MRRHRLFLYPWSRGAHTQRIYARHQSWRSTWLRLDLADTKLLDQSLQLGLQCLQSRIRVEPDLGVRHTRHPESPG